jgi:hypothetical protein
VLECDLINEEDSLWKELVNFTKAFGAWAEIQSFGHKVLRFNIAGKEIMKAIAHAYTEHVRVVVPLAVLDKNMRTLVRGGDITDEWIRGEQGSGFLSKKNFIVALGTLTTIISFGTVLDLKKWVLNPTPYPPATYYLGCLDAPKIPAIVPFFLQNYGGKAQIQAVVNDVRREVGFYEEFDWDELNLGIVMDE